MLEEPHRLGIVGRPSSSGRRAGRGQIVLLDRRNWRPHRFWILWVLVLGILFNFWYFAAALLFREPYWPGGSSFPGFACGVAGGLIIIFEMLLWLRKRYRIWRVGQAQAWMRA